MRIFISLIIFLLIYSCSTKNQNSGKEEKTFPIVIDSSAFVMNLEYNKIKHKKLNDNQRLSFNLENINTKVKDKYLFLFYLVDSLEVSENLSILITYAARNNTIALDAYYEKYILTTLDINKKPIESIEIGKYESHFGSTIIKTAEITDSLKIGIKTIEYIENLNTGEITKIKSNEDYFIDSKGEINKKHQ